MTEQIIVMTAEQLRAIVADEVNAILPKLADFRRKNEPVVTDGMTVEAPDGIFPAGAARLDRIPYRTP